MYVFTSERGVSPVVGVILVVAITVLLSAAVGALVFDLGQQTPTSDTNQELGVRTSTNATHVSVQVVTGEADDLKILVNGTVEDSKTNIQPGDTLSAPANADSEVTVVTTSSGSTTVVSTSNPFETGSTQSGDSSLDPIMLTDSFDDNAINTSKWTVYLPGGCGDVREENQEIHLVSGGANDCRPYLKTADNQTDAQNGESITITLDGRMETGSRDGQLLMISWWDGQAYGTYSHPNNAVYAYQQHENDKMGIYKVEGGSRTELAVVAHTTSSTMKEYQFVVEGNFSNFDATVYVDGAKLVSTTGNSFSPTADAGYAGVSGREEYKDTYVDNMNVTVYPSE